MSEQEKETVTFRLYAAARAAAGKNEIMVNAGRLDDILNSLCRDNARLREVFSQCSFLVDGLVTHEHAVHISSGSTVDVLPPFAGG